MGRILKLRGADGTWLEVPAIKGSTGATFTPSVSDDGLLSWTNDRGLENPKPISIKGPTGPIGPTGSVGDDGATYIPSVSDEGLLSWTNNKGLENPKPISIKGPTGPTGSVGDDGATYTPHLSETGDLTWTNDKGLPNPDPVNLMGQNGIWVDPSEPPEGYDVWIVVDAESSGSGSTEEVLAELLDARTGYDGTTYTSVGSAIRTQIQEIHRVLSDYEVSTDTTLSVSGAPADSKATGDAIKNLDKSIPSWARQEKKPSYSADEVGALAKDGTAVNSNKLGGKLPSEYLGATAQAADSAKLGGKAPEYYIQPRNLLDNSDWERISKIVNQRGQTSYTGGYTIDRWVLYGTDKLTINHGYITVSGDLYQYIPIDVIHDGMYTVCACKRDGTIVTFSRSSTAGVDWHNGLAFGLDSSGEKIAIGLRSGDYVWAALYEGSYTADTLPPYVPKGYAQELAACGGYDQAGMISDAWSAGHTYAEGEYAIYNGSLWRCLVANTGVTPTEGSNWTRCSLSDELKKNIASIVNPTVMDPNNSAATLIGGGYVRIGRLIVINIRASVSAMETDTILFTGFPIPLSTAVNVVRLNCQIDCYVDPNGNIRNGEKIAASMNLMINGVYITQA